MRLVHGAAWPILASVVALALVIPTWSRLSYTNDEPAHIAAGMEWIAEGRYTYEEQHPPLSRIAAALGPYLLGVRPLGHAAMWNEGRSLLQDSAVPMERVLAAARAGILPFLVLAIFLTWHIGRVVWSNEVGAVAAFLLATTPVFLGHSGLATTDAGAATMLLLAVWLLMRLFERPTPGRAAAAGAGIALSLMAKLTAVLFLGAAIATLVGALLIRGDLRGRLRRSGWTRRDALRLGGALAATVFLVMWATFRFSVGPLADPADMPFEGIDAVFGESGVLHDVAYRVVTLPVPGAELLTGLRQVVAYGSAGRKSYFMGEVSESGWALFFPVALLIKTPLPLLLLVAAGWGFAIARAREVTWQALAVLVLPLAFIVAVMPARLHIGLRHLLIVYPFLALAAGAGAIRLAHALPRHRAGALLVGALVAWQAVAVVRAFPDYIAYFNEPFEDSPQDFLVFSDLAWGQDLYRLRDRLEAVGAESVTIAQMGNLSSRRLELHGLPPVSWLEPFTPVAGWIAVDWYSLKVGSAADRRVPHDAFQWLLDHEPVEEVGAGMRLYHFDRPPELSAGMLERRRQWLALGIADEVQTPDVMEATSYGPLKDPDGKSGDGR